MNSISIPISTLFIGINGSIAFALSYIVVMERTKTRIWHGESKEDVASQPNYLENPNQWAALVENITQKSVATKTSDDGVLQRKVRAYGNFTEYVPLALLFILALELMASPSWLLWLLGVTLTVARIAHAWGLITTYGPSPARAIGFFLTWFVYIVGASACIYYGIIGIVF
ncbi:MAG TPA: MAPEG family protein [Leptolyngbyaceae cyanobacterium]